MIKHFISTKKFLVLSKLDLKKLEVDKTMLVSLILENINKSNYPEIEKICRAYKSDKESGLYFCHQAAGIFAVCDELGYNLTLQKFHQSNFVEDWVKVIFNKLL